MSDEKPPKMDDTTSATASPTASFSEKALEAEEKTLHAEPLTGEATPAPPITEEKQDPELNKVMSAKEALDELNKAVTSGEGVEYPTGLRLNLVTLALCLAVFLVALDNTIIATAIPKITDQFHSLPGKFLREKDCYIVAFADIAY
jgi:hypothetical protein